MVAAVPQQQAGPDGTPTKLFSPGPILLLGAPGAGKSTQAQLLTDKWLVPQISTGDLLRDMRKHPEKNVTLLGQQILKMMDDGHLIPDEMMQEIILDRLRQPDTKRGYVLDGFPRTLSQAEWLDGQMDGTIKGLPVIAVSIRVSYTGLLRRIIGRRYCPTCARIFNIYDHSPEQKIVCDADGTVLTQRPDDTEEVLSERMRTYREMTTPVVEHYHTTTRFAEVNGDLPVEETNRAIVDAIVRLRS